ncbi:MAG: PLP-dependent aminotransferase family protein [Gammaproteobacteria bacterium]|nr:PLP-dependent aminotransferase family protein [Gammaproteobacteria bacterium]
MTLSLRTRTLGASPVREILKIATQSETISFAGGLPSADCFPALDYASLDDHCLQYGTSEGDTPLREAVVELMARRGLICTVEQVLVLSGSQQGIDLVAKLMIDPGTPVAVEAPTYIAALQAFRFFGAAFKPFNVGEPLPDAPLVYINPTFQNPTGYCYSVDERQSIAAQAKNSVLFEDDPYHDLNFDALPTPPIVTFCENQSWIYQSSFSKSLAPGLRLGFIVASADLIDTLTYLKQAADLHSCRISQSLVTSFLSTDKMATHNAQLCERYQAKRDIFDEAITRHCSDLGRWTPPAGGLFFWLQLNQQIDAIALLQQCLTRKVAFMPGEHFYASAVNQSAIRLNFSNAPIDQIDHGVSIIAEEIRRAYEQKTS